MLTLNKHQHEYLKTQLNLQVKDLNDYLSSMIDARSRGFGDVSYRLKWDTATIMLTDRLCYEYNRLLQMTSGEKENNATLETLTEYYQRAQEEWSPEHSTSVVSNLEHEQKLEVIKRILRDLNTIKRL